MTPKVLLVDDEKDFVEFVRPTLEQAGMEVTVAYSGKEALAAIQNDKPHVVVTDIVMPEMNGIELIEEISRTEPDILVITVTGYADWDEKLHAIKDVVKVSLLKPIRLDDVLSSVDICLAVSKPAMVKKGK